MSECRTDREIMEHLGSATRESLLSSKQQSQSIEAFSAQAKIPKIIHQEGHVLAIQSHNSFNNCKSGVGIGGDISPVLDRTITVALNVSQFAYEETGKAPGDEERQRLLT